MSGNNVSHSNRKTRRRFLPNLQTKEFYIPEEDRKVKLKVCHKGLRTIDKNGIKATVDAMRARGEKV
jgi:large subunit ribosomal protein L28